VDQVTETLSEYAFELSHADLTEQATHGMLGRLVDSVGCALGAYDGEPSVVAQQMARAASGKPPARVLLSGDVTSPEMAAFANTMMVRYLDFNDTYFAAQGGHPSDTIGAMLAVAGAWELSGRDAMLGMVTAFEIFAALGECDWRIGQPPRLAVSTAAATAKILGLGRAGIANAISLAFVSNSSTPGEASDVISGGHQSMWKAGGPANAARGGLFAARLAALGMTGPQEPFKAKGAQASERTVPALGGRGAEFHTHRTSIKFFPAQFNCQAGIFAAIQMRKALGGVPVESVTVSTYRHAYLSTSGPEKWDIVNRETADHSMPYVVAAALLDGELGVSQFTQERIDDPALQALMRRITVREDPEMTELFPDAQVTSIEAVTSDGTTHHVEVTHPRGHYRNPMTDEDIERKFRSMALAHMTPDACDAALARLWAIESEANVADLVAALKV
jgi:2-methylcitrate dehydratase